MKKKISLSLSFPFIGGVVSDYIASLLSLPVSQSITDGDAYHLFFLLLLSIVCANVVHCLDYRRSLLVGFSTRSVFLTLSMNSSAFKTFMISHRVPRFKFSAVVAHLPLCSHLLPRTPDAAPAIPNLPQQHLGLQSLGQGKSVSP